MPTLRQTHVFDIVRDRKAFLDGIPSVIGVAVQKARRLTPNHPPFAIGVMAHFIAHHDLAIASEDGFYQEAHLVNQCRGAFVLKDLGKSYTCFLASGHPSDTTTFKVHRKGAMTIGAQPEQGVLFALDEGIEGEGSHFFLVVESFLEGRGVEKRRIYLVWGRLIDRTTVQADYSHLIGDEDLGTPAPFAPNADLPPIEDATPLIDVEEA